MQQLFIFVKLMKAFAQTSDVCPQPIGVCDVPGEDS